MVIQDETFDSSHSAVRTGGLEVTLDISPLIKRRGAVVIVWVLILVRAVAVIGVFIIVRLGRIGVGDLL